MLSPSPSLSSSVFEHTVVLFTGLLWNADWQRWNEKNVSQKRKMTTLGWDPTADAWKKTIAENKWKKTTTDKKKIGWNERALYNANCEWSSAYCCFRCSYCCCSPLILYSFDVSLQSPNTYGTSGSSEKKTTECEMKRNAERTQARVIKYRYWLWYAFSSCFFLYFFL